MNERLKQEGHSGQPTQSQPARLVFDVTAEHDHGQWWLVSDTRRGRRKQRRLRRERMEREAAHRVAQRAEARAIVEKCEAAAARQREMEEGGLDGRTRVRRPNVVGGL